MKLLLTIGAGSFIGGIGRFLLSQWVQTKFASPFPLPTLIVNLVGCFAIGLAFALAEKALMSQQWLLFLTTGLLGGFTTFSAFSNETIQLCRSGQFAHALGYVFSSVLLGLLATFLGYLIIKFF